MGTKMITKADLVQFKEWTCIVSFQHYRNDRTALRLDEACLVDEPNPFYVNGECIAVATINVPEVPLQPDEVIIKNYSENEGMYDCLHKAGYISEPLYHIQTGYVTALVCKLLKTE